jgi:type I restriction enzyme S subunit
MEVRSGYKQTDVGLIPDDWEVQSVGSFSTIFGRIGFRGYTKKDIVSEGQGAIALNPSNVQGGRLVLDKCTYVTWEKYHESPEIKIQEGDVILVKTGSTTGKTCYVDHLPIEATLNPQMVVFKQLSVDSKLVAYIFSSPIFLGQIAATIVGGALPTLSQKQVASYKIPLPASRAEQRAIATALSDVDALLGGLDRLITKKRDLKQAVIQRLLTGQTRLPGFRGEWVVKRLGECLLSRPDYGINAPAVPFSDRHPSYIRITDISENGRYSPDPRVSVQVASSYQYYLHNGDVVFARTGASVGKSYLYEPRDGELVFAGYLIRVCPDPNVLVPAFLAAYATTKPYWNWVRMMSMRSGQPGINGSEYAQLPLSLPSPTEQTAITVVLSDVDAELAALEARREKTRDLKQAMMQELLTGKTRLVSAGAAHA